jgi:hypothetical protein
VRAVSCVVFAVVCGNLPACSGSPSTNSCNGVGAAAGSDPCASGGANTGTGGGGAATGGSSQASGGSAVAGNGGVAGGGAGGVSSTCVGGVCGCAAGFTGDNCDQCLIHVDGNKGKDTNDGSTWALAFATVQAGLDAAVAKIPGSVSTCEVWVAEGTYRPTTGTDRAATVQLKPGVALYGGFVGTEVTRAVRDTTAHVTTLSGDIGAIDNTTDNAYHVVTGVTGATIDGFTITGGNADGSDTAGTGGGMLNVGSAPTVTNCSFFGNSAQDGGGGMLNAGSAPTVTNCSFSGNSANYGGGMYNLMNSSPTVSDCRFLSNTATLGGGMLNASSSPTVTLCGFSANFATSGGAMYNLTNSSPKVTDCTFTGNNATYAGGMYNSDQSSPTVSNCRFLSNTATYGGGMFSNKASPMLTNSAFTDNSATDGGGMYNSSSSPAVTNCTFTGNSASGYSGGMGNNASSPTVTNCTFSLNKAGISGGGVLNYDRSSPTVTNCILWGNNSPTASGNEVHNYDSTCSPVVTYSIVAGGYQGTGNINADPLFANAADGDVHLKSDSPAIDAAQGCLSTVVPLTDKDGKGRWDIAAKTNAPGTLGVDIGAFEFQGGSGDTRLTTLCALEPKEPKL